ncbi:MAG: metallophosphoesterase [Candidatus Muproteobacteria bacterium RBG_16_62_13]|uniref:Metallophosphoesterase n=1 Tax=Candidatus Muproteobacteria bacterium RBG_16_62_13 TaxID=1817756 RepID=A0A1F6T5T6_9PROT|nr:MAG: metallophosphoesterase [Candidatus Muproteobacteria bacterium RBG_16_62_13]
MKILVIGDVMGGPGRRVLCATLPVLRERHQPDLVIANAENIAGGAGITPATAQELLDAGVDVLTNGNHAWDKSEVIDYIAREPRLLRPHNYPEDAPGSGWFIVTTTRGQRVGVLNLLGTVFMHPHLACPFRTADRVLAGKPDDVKTVIVDFHAEVTSEKTTLGFYLDGRVSAVVGTHTHVATADERILPKGTAYQTDIGMTGCCGSVIGLDVDKAIARFVKKLPAPYDLAEGPASLCGALIDVDDQSGLARSIERVRIDEANRQQAAKPFIRRA